MGLTCTLYRATDADIERFIEDPEALDAFVETIDGPPVQMRPVRRYHPERMTAINIYPTAIWSRPAPPEESPLAWLLDCHSAITTFMKNVAASGDGVVISIG